jgi:hypothetical protein
MIQSRVDKLSDKLSSRHAVQASVVFHNLQFVNAERFCSHLPW